MSYDGASFLPANSNGARRPSTRDCSRYPAGSLRCRARQGVCPGYGIEEGNAEDKGELRAWVSLTRFIPRSPARIVLRYAHAAGLAEDCRWALRERKGPSIAAMETNPPTDNPSAWSFKEAHEIGSIAHGSSNWLFGGVTGPSSLLCGSLSIGCRPSPYQGPSVPVRAGPSICVHGAGAECRAARCVISRGERARWLGSNIREKLRLGT